MRVFYLLLSASTFSHEGEGGGEDWLTSLPSLDGACAEAAPFADMFDVVDEWDFGVAVEHEVTVHAVYCEIVGDCSLCGCEALCYGCSAVDASSAWWVP